MDEWTELRGYPNYKINKSGDVKRIGFIDQFGRVRADRRIKPRKIIYGEKRVGRALSNGPYVRLTGAKTSWLSVADLLAATFLPPFDRTTHQILFKDSNPANACLSNITVQLKSHGRLLKKLEKLNKNNNLGDTAYDIS